MLNQLIENIQEQIKEKYPYLECPVAMYATITSKSVTEKEKKEECAIQDKQYGIIKESIIIKKQYRYGIKIIDNTGKVLATYPAFPNIESTLSCNVGDRVIILFVGGELNPMIVGAI